MQTNQRIKEGWSTVQLLIALLIREFFPFICEWLQDDYSLTWKTSLKETEQHKNEY